MAEIRGFQAYVLGFVKKTDLIFDVSDVTVQTGIINTVQLNVDDDYLPNGELVASDLLDIEVKYNNLIIPAEYNDELNDYCFELDLTQKIDENPVKLEIIVNEIDVVNPARINLKLNCAYATASTFEELQNQLQSNEIVELTDTIQCTENLILSKNTHLIGNDNTLILSTNSIILSEEVQCKLEKINFIGGSPAIIQSENTKLIVENCSFTNATISDMHKGSVLSTLIGENIQSEFNGCSIFNCHHSIYHCSDLTVNYMKAYYNNFDENVDTDYSEFLTQYEGSAEIQNSVFDIDFDTDYLCTNQIDIKFAESLIGIGENATLNGYRGELLLANNSLPLCISPFNNQSHIFCKYYYETIEQCVITSPILEKEDKCACHTVLGQDYVFKNNAQVTRSDWQTENRIKKIMWEE